MDEPQKEKGVGGAIVIMVVIAVLMIFGPLVLSFAEHKLLGSHHVEETCRRLGLHGILGRIYEPVMRLFGIR